MIPSTPDPDGPAPGLTGRVPQQAHGLRLDKALALVFPGLTAGLRARRRLCERGAVLLRERTAGPASKVRAGDAVRLLPGHTPGQIAGDGSSGRDSPALVLSDERFAALYKPSGLHSASVAGSAAPCLEALLPRLLGLSAGQEELSGIAPFPRLLNRLDRDTSGLVLAARCEAGAGIWREAENEGRIDKRYLAVLEGDLARNQRVRLALDTVDRRISRVRAVPDPDPLRHTDIVPLGNIPPCPLFPDAPIPLTLAGCRIRKGARHQIRAHLAALGHPLAGDSLYGATLQGPYRLHHALLALPGFSAHFLPNWLDRLPPGLAEAARFYLALKMDLL